MAQKNKATVTVGFVALGCPKNIVDSEKMLADIAQGGFLISSEPADSDVVIINTCGFIAPAKAEALDVIRSAVGWKRTRAVKKVIVAGCLSERLGKRLFEEADGIDAIVGLGQRNDICSVIRQTLSSQDTSAFLGHSREMISDDRIRLLIGPAHRAYLRISEGCDWKCSFCTIPAIRGRFRSKPLEMVLAEASELADAGVVELNVIGQDTTGWGSDLKIRDGLAVLLRELERVKSIEWIRLLYLYPARITDRLIETIAVSEKVVHYLDIPLQHIDNEILKKMCRPDTKDAICRLIEKIRRALPDVVLRTSLIVGFPSESDEQFEELLEFVNWAGFDALGCFQYYAEEGTEAAGLKQQIPEKVKQERFKELMIYQQKTAFEKNKRRIGSELVCLVDTVDGKSGGIGRYFGQAPDIDGVCIIKGYRGRAGVFINVKVIGTKDYDLIVKQIKP